MKNQYFGDINDYKKYGLLRAIIRTVHFNPLIAWMLTPDDGSTDGMIIEYLQKPEIWELHDPELFNGLKDLLHSDSERAVDLIENTDLLSNTKFFSQYVPDASVDRGRWFSELIEASGQHDFIFLDPDNGIEIKSTPYGRKNSSKFLYWHEIDALWSTGKSLLIYQQFIRENRNSFIHRMLMSLKEKTQDSYVAAFSTSYVVFLMALQQKHQNAQEAVVEALQNDWGDQIGYSKQRLNS